MDFETCMEERGLTDRDLASTLGVSPSTVWRWRKGERFPERAHWAALAEHVGWQPTIPAPVKPKRRKAKGKKA